MKIRIGKQDCLFWVMFVGVLFVHLSRIRMGLVDIDESFYLTVPYRLCQGDALLVDESHVSQLVGFLLYPIMKLYLFLFNSTEGIYLSFRYIYLVFLMMTGLLSYYILKKRDNVLAALSSIVFCLFSPFCIKALSYNTIGLMAVWLLVVISLAEIKNIRMKYIFMGILLAMIILCNPYMIIFYAGYSAICFWYGKKTVQIYRIREWFLVSCGAGIVAILFVAFVLSRASLSEVVNNLEFILNDPAHESKTIIQFFQPIIWFVSWFKLFFIIFFGGFLVAFLKPGLRKFMFQGMMLLCMVLWILLIVFKTQGVGKHAIMLPLTLLGGVAFTFTEEKKWDLFCQGWLVGVIYALCMNMASNQGIYVICNGCTISSCISIFLIKYYFDEQEEWNWKKYWFVSLVVMQILTEVWILRNYAMWEDDMTILTHRIEAGPLKGVYTTEEKKNIYEVNYSNIKSLGNLSGKNLMCYNGYPCGYLIASEARNCAFSAWMTEYSTMDHEKIGEYYRIHPDKKPDVIYIDTYALADYCDWGDAEWDQWCENNGYRRECLQGGSSALWVQ